MSKKLQILEQQIEEVQELTTFVESLRLDVVESNLADCVDIAYVTARCEEKLKALRSSLDNISMFAQAQAGELMMMSNTRQVQTQRVTATLRSKVWHRLVSTKDKVKYAETLKSMGIPDEVANNELVRLHAPAMAEYYHAKSGRELPANITNKDISSVQLVLTMRGRKESDVSDVPEAVE